MADEDGRKEIGRRHWTPNWWQALLLIAAMVAFGVAFWPRG